MNQDNQNATWRNSLNLILFENTNEYIPKMILKLIKYGYTYMIKDRDLNEFQNHIALLTVKHTVDIQSLVIKNSAAFF